eukprot:jgi/Orpsp1_1/1186499/evm.model.d7180000051039.1
MVHVLFTLIWILKNEINSILAYTKDLKEYTKCVFPESNIISVIFNFIILFLGSKLAYSTRYAQKNFKENIFFPVFAYIIFTVLIEIVNIEEDISTMVHDLFNSVGTIINIYIILQFLFIEKFISISESKENISNSYNNNEHNNQIKFINNSTFLSEIK